MTGVGSLWRRMTMPLVKSLLANDSRLLSAGPRRWSLLAIALLLLAGCQQGFHPHVGRSAAFEHWFPVVHTHAPHGINTHSRPPCPYFDPPPANGGYVFCEECGVWHAAR